MLEKMKLANVEEKPKRQIKTALKYFDKTIETMKVLMKILGIEVFFD